MIRVIFVLRHDAFTKPGGDTSKVERYLEHFKSFGIDARVVTSAEELKDTRAHVCHLVNLDLPRTNARVARVAKLLGMKVVLSTVSHPIGGLTAMYDHSADRYFQGLRKMRVPAERGLSSREWLRLALAENSLVGSPFRTLTRSQTTLIDLADGILPMARGEQQELNNRFGTKAARFVANGLNFHARQGQPMPRTYQMAAVGRIEPRKNMLELARAAKEHNIPLVVAGAINAKHRTYVSEFMGVMASSPKSQYVGRLDRSGVQTLLLSSTHYANLSWCEVVSQADMEAASLGCKLLLTEYSYTHEFLTNPPLLHKPEQVLHSQEGRSKFAEIVSLSEESSPLTRYSWRGATEQIARFYQELLR